MLVTVCMEQNKMIHEKPTCQRACGFFEKYDKRLMSFLEKSMYTEH